MVDHAIVIGIDAYPHAPNWALRAAVRDAVKFAEWVTADGAGRASPATLTLLLSAHADSPPNTKLSHKLADQKAIEDVLYDYSRAKEKKGKDGSRLWFFYAGHGVAPGGGGADEAPILVPCDLDDPDRYFGTRPIELTSFLRAMQIAPPAEQLYFIDACRGIVKAEDVVTQSQHLHFNLAKLDDAAKAQAKQAVLYATTAGQLANEYKLHGLFGGALLDGLAGRGPKLEPDKKKLDYVLSFDALAAFTRRRIQLQAEEERKQRRELPTQEPASDLFRAEGSLQIARFEKRPKVKLRVFVEPAAARDHGTAGIRVHHESEDEWRREFPLPSKDGDPLPEPLVWELAPGTHRVEVESASYQDWVEVIELIGDKTMPARLVEDAGLESFVPKSGGLEFVAGGTGEVAIDARDRLAHIEVFDAKNERVSAGWESLTTKLPVGSYRVEVSFPTEPILSMVVLVTGDARQVLEFQPAIELVPSLQAALAPLGMNPQRGMTMPSEQFGPTTTTHLGSLLAWAAWAARFPAGGDGQKLRSIGVDSLPAADPTRAYVQVIVGDEYSVEAGVEGLSIAFGAIGAEQHVPPKPVDGLPGLAMQWMGEVSSGDESPCLQLAGLEPKSFPVHALPGFVAVIIVVREASGRIEIHRYLNPVVPNAGFSDAIRRIEQSWRALEARTPLFDGEAEALLKMPLDPLSLAVLGYRLAREGKLEALGPRLDELAASGLPDGKILQALAGGDRGAALAAGIPALGEGYRLLDAWLTARAAASNSAPPVASRPFTGGFWTSFDTRARKVESRAFALQDAPEWAAPVRRAAEATARLESPGTPYPFAGTGWLVSDGVLATASFVMKALAPSGWLAAFDLDKARIAVESLLATTTSDPAIAFMKVDSAGVTPAQVRRSLPRIGQRIVVVGHPVADTRVPEAAIASAYTAVPNGAKVIMPGVIVAVEPTKLTYECWTMGGSAGGPIVDLDTGEVIGIHHSGKYDEETKVKVGYGLPLVALPESAWEKD
jgi:hypothetical protein